MSDKLQFIHEDAATIVAEMVADYEARVNRRLSPADPIMLLINAYAYRELLLRVGINETGRQSLVSFSYGIALDYLAELVGVVRLPEQPAFCTIRFTLIDGHTGITIPEGIRIQSADGQAIFKTIAERTVPIGTLYTDMECIAMNAGEGGNNYEAGKINIILDPQAYLVSAENITVSQGGSNNETDEQLRERVKLAPNSFSVAGSRDAYRFFAKSVSPDIVDVAITSLTPGVINIYPLLSDGTLPGSDLINKVLEVCSGEKVRPLTDTVQVAAPTKIDYAIAVDIKLVTGAINTDAQQKIFNVLNDFATERKSQLGLDVVRSKIVSICMLDNVYSCTVVSPANDIVVLENEFTNCTGITVNITGTSDR